jgi:hypothetical protein
VPKRRSSPKRHRSLFAIAAMAALAAALTGQVNGDDPVIDKARNAASVFTESLPKYLVKRTTTRYQSTVAVCALASLQSGQLCQAKESWHTIDTVTADVTAENGKESYTNIRLNGKLATDPHESGSWSEGEFSNTLWAILSPESNASFTKQQAVTLANRPAFRYEFSIDQAHSSWRLYVTASGYAPAYGGTIWIDRETSRVLRVEMSARNMPQAFPLATAGSIVEYAFVKIGGEDYLVPSHSEVIYCQREVTACSKNVTDFKDYKKYSADTTIQFEDAPK